MADENNSSERMFKNIMDKLSSLEDMDNLTQLDIINMKNEVEKLKLTSSSPMSPEAEERIVRLENLSKDVDMFKRWKETVDEVKFLRDRLMKPPEQEKRAENAEEADKTNEMKEIRDAIEEMRAELKARKAAPIDLDDVKNAIEENRKAVGNLKQMITGKPKGAMPEAEAVKRMIRENRKLIGDLKSRMEIKHLDVPAGMHQQIESLHAEITKLEEEVRKLKTGEKTSGARPKDEMEHLRSELFGKLDELNVKFGPKGSDEIRKAMEANRASIEKLKTLVAGEEVDINGLKYEINENRKFMAEVKGLVLSKKQQVAGKISVPPDPEMRNRLAKLEERLEFLSKKMERLTELKPIKIPEFGPAEKTKAAMARPGEIEGVRKEIDNIVLRMDGFLTKDDIEKGFLEKRLKTDEKLLTGEIYKELNDIKKAILRNEDHITNVATDVERMKKEVGTVEKREWGKGRESPTINDLRQRIDDLEKRVESSQEGPMFIE